MLKGIDPLLTPELLMRLAQLGHNEWIAVVDANFTAVLLAGGKPVVRLPGHPLLRCVQAICSVVPVCSDVPQPVGYMQVSDQPVGYLTPTQAAVTQLVCDGNLLQTHHVEAIERFAFYERVKAASLIVQTGDMTPYANVLLCKDGVFH